MPWVQGCDIPIANYFRHQKILSSKQIYKYESHAWHASYVYMTTTIDCDCIATIA